MFRPLFPSLLCLLVALLLATPTCALSPSQHRQLVAQAAHEAAVQLPCYSVAGRQCHSHERPGDNTDGARVQQVPDDEAMPCYMQDGRRCHSHRRPANVQMVARAEPTGSDGERLPCYDIANRHCHSHHRPGDGFSLRRRQLITIDFSGPSLEQSASAAPTSTASAATLPASSSSRPAPEAATSVDEPPAAESSSRSTTPAVPPSSAAQTSSVEVQTPASTSLAPSTVAAPTTSSASSLATSTSPTAVPSSSVIVQPSAVSPPTASRPAPSAAALYPLYTSLPSISRFGVEPHLLPGEATELSAIIVGALALLFAVVLLASKRRVSRPVMLLLAGLGLSGLSSLVLLFSRARGPGILVGLLHPIWTTLLLLWLGLATQTLSKERLDEQQVATQRQSFRPQDFGFAISSLPTTPGTMSTAVPESRHHVLVRRTLLIVIGGMAPLDLAAAVLFVVGPVAAAGALDRAAAVVHAGVLGVMLVRLAVVAKHQSSKERLGQLAVLVSIVVLLALACTSLALPGFRRSPLGMALSSIIGLAFLGASLLLWPAERQASRRAGSSYFTELPTPERRGGPPPYSRCTGWRIDSCTKSPVSVYIPEVDRARTPIQERGVSVVYSQSPPEVTQMQADFVFPVAFSNPHGDLSRDWSESLPVPPARRQSAAAPGSGKQVRPDTATSTATCETFNSDERHTAQAVIVEVAEVMPAVERTHARMVSLGSTPSLSRKGTARTQRSATMNSSKNLPPLPGSTEVCRSVSTATNASDARATHIHGELLDRFPTPPSSPAKQKERDSPRKTAPRASPLTAAADKWTAEPDFTTAWPQDAACTGEVEADGASRANVKRSSSHTHLSVTSFMSSLARSKVYPRTASSEQSRPSTSATRDDFVADAGAPAVPKLPATATAAAAAESTPTFEVTQRYSDLPYPSPAFLGHAGRGKSTSSMASQQSATSPQSPAYLLAPGTFSSAGSTYRDSGSSQPTQYGTPRGSAVLEPESQLPYYDD